MGLCANTSETHPTDAGEATPGVELLPIGSVEAVVARSFLAESLGEERRILILDFFWG